MNNSVLFIGNPDGIGPAATAALLKQGWGDVVAISRPVI